jgi:hypothetical protein
LQRVKIKRARKDSKNLKAMKSTILDKRVKPGMVFRWEEGKPEVIVTRVDGHEVVVYGFDGRWSATYGRGWFKTGNFEFIRQMGVREYNKLINCNL